MNSQFGKKLSLLVVAAICVAGVAKADPMPVRERAPVTSEGAPSETGLSESAGRGRAISPSGVVAPAPRRSGLGSATVSPSMARPGGGAPILIPGASVGTGANSNRVAPSAAAVRGGAEQVGSRNTAVTGDVSNYSSAASAGTTGQVGHATQTAEQRAAMRPSDALEARAQDSACDLGANVCSAIAQVPAAKRPEALAASLAMRQAAERICGGGLCAEGKALAASAAFADVKSLALGDASPLSGASRSTCTGTFGVAAVRTFLNVVGSPEVAATLTPAHNRAARMGALERAYARIMARQGKTQESTLTGMQQLKGACGTFAAQ